MKTVNRTFQTFLMAFLMFTAFTVNAQETLTLNGKSEFKVSGTSTIHDWDMISDNGQKGSAKIKLDNGKIASIETLKVSFPANTLKSGKNGMDKNAYEALNVKKHPEILFELTEVLDISDKVIKAKGNLTIAGKTQNVPMDVNYTVSGNKVNFSGNQNIKFTQFNIDPPTAMFNTIKTGDDLKVSFNTTFN
ncbi:YceI family protein [Litoribacter populi]|uniref:YceI family protein n=1 Tax=Litoribacter populi TaxID=2598460 RepID=UPI00117F0B0A|nr:YceI family protein [Litoribacter populi]